MSLNIGIDAVISITHYFVTHACRTQTRVRKKIFQLLFLSLVDEIVWLVYVLGTELSMHTYPLTYVSPLELIDVLLRKISLAIH